MSYFNWKNRQEGHEAQVQEASPQTYDSLFLILIFSSFLSVFQVPPESDTYSISKPNCSKNHKLGLVSELVDYFRCGYSYSQQSQKFQL